MFPEARPCRLAVAFLLALASCTLTDCGGGGGSALPGGLALLSFGQADVDSVALTEVLIFRFSEPVDPNSIMVTDPLAPAFRRGTGAIQIREGDAFGRTVSGYFEVEGSRVRFHPGVPGRCDYTDGGLRPATRYRVVVTGSPEEEPVRGLNGDGATETRFLEFSTTADESDLFRGRGIQAAPDLVASAPQDGEAGVPVVAGNLITLSFTENLHPCSVDEASVRLLVCEIGERTALDPALHAIPAGEPNAGRVSGFVPWADQVRGDPYRWAAAGAATRLSPRQVVPCEVVLKQDPWSTQIRLRPLAGWFPENALLVVELAGTLRDLDGVALQARAIAFTTENVPPGVRTLPITFEADAEPWPEASRTADVDTTRSPGRVQGWRLLAGDGDNGAEERTPAYPRAPADCAPQANDGKLDDLIVRTGQTVVLDTGPRTRCVNPVDGSTAVVFEFRKLHVEAGGVLQIIGANPVILQARDSARVDAGGVILARGGDGGDASNYQNKYGVDGGVAGLAVAGGGDGGRSRSEAIAWVGSRILPSGDDGVAGAGSVDYPTVAARGGEGAGLGGTRVRGSRGGMGVSSPAGGGGGHAVPGEDGMKLPGTGVILLGPSRSFGGAAYPFGGDAEWMLRPSAGSGGGGAGNATWEFGWNSDWNEAAGGGGGAGGGFVDITSTGDILIYGRIDVSGGHGGRGGIGGHFSGGGGGGGSGGGLRVLTPGRIDVRGATLDASGGVGGAGARALWHVTVPNAGGRGGHGRIVLEDGDGWIDGLPAATLTPGTAQVGFRTRRFDPTRFGASSRVTEAVSGAFLVAAIGSPSFVDVRPQDLEAAIPAGTGRGLGSVTAIVEAQGMDIAADGSVLAPTGGWFTLGTLRDSGVPHIPTWIPAQNPPAGDGALPGAGNAGVGVAALNGSRALRLRVRFFVPGDLSSSVGAGWIDTLGIRFAWDQ